MAMQIVVSPGSSNHNQCFTVANQTLNAYGKWAGCPGGSGPGYSSTMRYVPNELSSGLGPNIGGAICNCTYKAPLNTNFPPINTAAPVISGNTIVGSTLTTTNGTWIGVPTPTFTYQWYRGVTLIIGQVNTTYVTQFADIGQAITCTVTATNISGSTAILSNVITPGIPPVNTIAPVISGNTVAGSTLTTTNGTWTGVPTPTFTYQWYRGVTLITGQVNTTYVTQFADIGQAITSNVTATNVNGSAVIASNVITPTTPPTVLLINTNNYLELIGTVTYYLAQGDTSYVMPAGSYMTSFSLYVDGTNIIMNFQNDSNTNLYTWSDNQSRVSSTLTTINLATAVNISGCSKFMFTNLYSASATYPGTGIANLGIMIYGYIIAS